MIFYIEIGVSFDATLEKEKSKNFNIQQNAIALLFGRFLEPYQNGLNKIRIELSDVLKNPIISGPDKYNPFAIIDWPFNFREYFELSRYERRKYINETLHQAMQAMCNELNYDFQPFQRAYEKVKELDYQNAYIHGKLKTAPDRKHKAGVHIRVEEEHAIISALVQDSEGNETTRIEILRTLPHYMFIYKFIHQTKWLNKEHFQISDKSGQVVFTVNVPEEKTRMELLPKTMELPELVKEVAIAVADETGML